jgi:calreticulin
VTCVLQEYKGVWEADDIPNPEYEGDDSLHVFNDLKYVGFELWQVKAGSIFDNIMVTDDIAAAKAATEEVLALVPAEKAMFEAAEELAKAEAEEAAKAAEEERKALEEEEDDEEEEEAEEEEHDEL